MKASFGFKNTGIKLTGDDVPVQVDSSTPVNLPFNPLKTETTTSHDQISEESRALENQHPASSISWGDGNVDEALQAQSTLIGNLSDSWTDTTEALQKVSDGGEIENSLYDWFKGVYTSLVDKSVKSWLNGIVTYLKSLAERVGLLEDDVLLKITLGNDVNTITFSTDKYGRPFSFGAGSAFEVIFAGRTSDTEVSYRAMILRLNGITAAEWGSSNTTKYTGVWGYLSPYIVNRWRFTVTDDMVQGTVFSNRGNTDFDTFLSNILTFYSKPVSTGGAIVPPITTLAIVSDTYTLKAGSVIYVKKIK